MNRLIIEWNGGTRQVWKIPDSVAVAISNLVSGLADLWSKESNDEGLCGLHGHDCED